MTTPAVYIDDYIHGSGSIDWTIWQLGVPVYSYTYSIGTQPERKVDIRPESGPSPIRADGTRAPRAWQHRKMVLGSPPTTITVWEGDKVDGYSTVLHGVSPQNISGGGANVHEELGLAWIFDEVGSSFPYGVESIATTRALEKLRNQKYEFGATLGELRETAKFVSDACGDLLGFVDTIALKAGVGKADAANFLRSVKKGDLERWLSGTTPRQQRQSAKRALKQSANKHLGRKAQAAMQVLMTGWLAYQFAVKPLLSDIDNGRQAIGEALFGETPRPPEVNIRSGHSEVTQMRVTLPTGSFGGANSTYRYVIESRCRINARYSISTTKDSRAQQWGLTNSFSVLYELTPFSWMFDYLTNTGEWIGSLLPVEGADFLEGSITRFQQAIGGPRGIQLTPRAGVTSVLPEWHTLVMNGMRIDRSLIPPVGLLPAFRPAFRNKLNLTKLANSLAAMAQLARKFT